MERDIIKVELELDRIVCRDEGDGWGNAEPYLWTVFFKVDGDSVVVLDDLTLGGTATVRTTPGSHGNLGTTDVDAGDTVTIPGAIGHWQTNLKPIPTPSALQALVPDVGGVIGVVAVLMEEDNVSDDGAEAGHQALNNAVRDAINQIVATRSFTNQEITDADVEGLANDVRGAISDAIQNQQNFFENLWSFLNPDDAIGDNIWFFSYDDLANGGTINFSQRWQNEGDWEIFGHLTATPLCPANSLDGLFSSRMSVRSFSAKAKFSAPKFMDPAQGDKFVKIDALERVPAATKESFDLKSLRSFRDGTFKTFPGLTQWWKLAGRTTPSLVRELTSSPALRKDVRAIMEYLPKAVHQLSDKLDDAALEAAERVFAALKNKTNNRRVAIDSSRALDMIGLIKGKKVGEAMQILSDIQPARHPATKGTVGLRIAKPKIKQVGR